MQKPEKSGETRQASVSDSIFQIFNTARFVVQGISNAETGQTISEFEQSLV